MSEIDNVLHAADLGVAALRARVAELEQSDAANSEYGSGMYERWLAADKEAKRLREELDNANRWQRTYRQERDQVRETDAKLLANYDRITLALYHYIVELSGHRDTARTKAERIALGHVVERLKEIRGIDDYERSGEL